MASQARRVAIVGQGYVGLPLALRAVAYGHDVVGVEVDESRVARLKASDSYVEDVSDDELAAGLGSGRYLPTSSVRDAAGSGGERLTAPPQPPSHWRSAP